MPSSRELFMIMERMAMEMVGAQLNREVIDGVEYWFTEPAPATTPDSPSVHLLQTYDEYIVGYSESRHVPLAMNQSGFTSAVVLDGQAGGRWKRTVRKDVSAGSEPRSRDQQKAVLVIEVMLDAPFDDAQTAALHAAAARYGDFLGLPATVTAAAARTAPQAAGPTARRSGDGGPPPRATPQPPRRR